MTETEEMLADAGKKIKQAAAVVGSSLEEAGDRYRRVFEAAAASLPGWKIGPDYWKYNHEEEILTRDVAFAGIHKRKKKGKKP